ncbi:hypothetical protein NDU88_011037 [Pleurodeles waltl]|uniref:IRG-type G domain-containing protein n=1 Tax=Pleurodeles waltl TaxID=8319 RepID=A0AAV7RZY1_PLEWA|nr:hypothetical protein NDU88_011037 [Pleurodeles waltl]
MADAKLDIAITGEAGSGKSTLVNCLRGLMDEGLESAKTGVVEMTDHPTPYQHPRYPTVTLWDLPGIGTPAFPTEGYFKKVNFDKYDVFIIVASERFKSNHALLARRIQDMSKRFYFVRTKLDVDLYAEKKKRKSVYNIEQILQQIKENCTQCLAVEGLNPSHVFLTSNFKLDKYDFPVLLKTLEDDILSCIQPNSRQSQWRIGCELQ